MEFKNFKKDVEAAFNNMIAAENCPIYRKALEEI